MVTEHGLEGGAIYALSAALRTQILQHGSASLFVDLLPDHSEEKVFEEVARGRGTRSMSSHLRSRLGIQGVKATLLRECLPTEAFDRPSTLAAGIKALPITLHASRPIDEAISTAGGVMFEGLTAGLMLREHPGIFVAGEMLDWEAPTGGYLLNGVLASGRVAGLNVVTWLKQRTRSKSNEHVKS
jgi:predicted flavoprotein YhiN